MTKLTIGDKAPAFTSTNEKGEKVSLADYKGKKLVLYFYPKDSTPGYNVPKQSIDIVIFRASRHGNKHFIQPS